MWNREYAGDNKIARYELKDLFPENPFNTPKPSKLIEKIIQIATDINSIILDSFSGSGTTAHAVLNLNKQDGGNREFILIEMEDYAETITAERVRRVMNGYADKEGTGGSFDFYTLGQTLFDEHGELNENVPIEKVRSYIWYSETKTAYTPMVPAASNGKAAYLGTNAQTAYYFYWNPGKATCLNIQWLRNLKNDAEQHVIYADNCTLNKAQLARYNIMFKKIPRDITKL